MGANSKIEWTDHTWSPVVGCSKIGAGCAKCYAIRHAHRLAANPNPKVAGAYFGLTEARRVGLPPTMHERADWTGVVRLIRERLDQPKSWRKPARVFVNPMSDLFHEVLSFEQIHEVWCAMTTPSARHHTYQILTKRYERAADFFDYLRDHLAREYGLTGSEPDAPEMLRLPQPHIWIGHSYSNQKDADAGMGHLFRTPATVRFVSLEPLLAPVNLGLLGAVPKDISQQYRLVRDLVGWVIVGGESGPEARPMHPQWARDVRDECIAAEVPFYFKQWGEWSPRECVEATRLDPPGSLQYFPDLDATFRRVGKKKAGRLLDGREHMEIPEVQRD